MINEKRICINKDCQEEYILTRNKPGKINVCRKCGEEEELDMKKEFVVPIRKKRVLN